MSATNTTTTTTAAAKRHGQTAAAVQVHTPGLRNVLDLPSAAITHMGKPASKDGHRLVLCSNYDAAAADPEGSCNLGSACRFVHADTANTFVRRGPHVNYAWRSAEDCVYPCFKPGQRCSIAPPNGKITSDVIASHLLLKTKALGAKRRPLSHCAHYYFNRACNLGADCQFIHAVFIDPEARKYQQAPAPVQLGRVDHRDAVKRIEARRATQSSNAAAAAAADAAAKPSKTSPHPAVGHHHHHHHHHGGAAHEMPHLPTIEVTMHHIAADPDVATVVTSPAVEGVKPVSPYLHVNTPRPGSAIAATPPPPMTVATSWCGRSRAGSTASLMSAPATPSLMGQPAMPASAGLYSMYTGGNESFNGSFSDDSALPAAAATYEATPVSPTPDAVAPARRTPSTRFRRDPYSPLGTPVMLTATPTATTSLLAAAPVAA